MLSKYIAAILALAVMSNAATIPPGSHVFTAEEVYHTIIDVAPYLVDRTTTVVWTQGPTVSVSTEVPTETDA